MSLFFHRPYVHSGFWFGAFWMPCFGVSETASSERYLCLVDLYSCLLFCESSIKIQVHKNIYIHQIYTSLPILKFRLCCKTFLFSFSSNGMAMFSYLRVHIMDCEIVCSLPRFNIVEP
jgi:hypothetical protein